jgi:hypothetical protein
MSSSEALLSVLHEISATLKEQTALTKEQNERLLRVEALLQKDMPPLLVRKESTNSQARLSEEGITMGSLDGLSSPIRRQPASTGGELNVEKHRKPGSLMTSVDEAATKQEELTGGKIIEVPYGGLSPALTELEISSREAENGFQEWLKPLRLVADDGRVKFPMTRETVSGYRGRHFANGFQKFLRLLQKADGELIVRDDNCQGSSLYFPGSYFRGMPHAIKSYDSSTKSVKLDLAEAEKIVELGGLETDVTGLHSVQLESFSKSMPARMWRVLENGNVAIFRRSVAPWRRI